jgi:hypothetical protein
MVPGRAGAPTGEQGAKSADYRAAADLIKVREVWATMSPNERAARLVDAIGLHLGRTGVHPPKVVAGTGENSSFKPGQWLIELGHPALHDPNPPLASFAEVCDHARHEWEHAVQEFRVIRQEAASTGETPGVLRRRLRVDREALERAIEVNRGGKHEEITGDLAVQATEIMESTRGIGAEDRADIMARLKLADNALAAARGTGNEATIARAREVYREAHREYETLPDEVLAWAAGRRMHEAVRRYTELATRIAEATQAVEDAHVELDTGGDRNAIRRLERRVREAQQDLKRLEREQKLTMAEDDT